jgi:hypothetical protein
MRERGAIAKSYVKSMCEDEGLKFKFIRSLMYGSGYIICEYTAMDGNSLKSYKYNITNNDLYNYELSILLEL